MKRFAIILTGALAACAAPPPERGVEAATVLPAADDWEAVILPEDRERLARTEDYWTGALAIAARKEPALAAREGRVIRPGNAMTAVPVTGAYRCRTIKLGGRLGAVAYNYFRCRIFDDSGQRWLVKETGSQRQSGRIFDDGVFLGGMALGDEQGAVGYGAITDRNVVGRFERLDEGHYRLVQPGPYYESALDILELKTAG